MNPLIQDLIDAAGHVNVAALNALPESIRTSVAEAIEAGGWPEVRIGLLNDAASVRVCLVNLDGNAIVLAHTDYVP